MQKCIVAGLAFALFLMALFTRCDADCPFNGLLIAEQGRNKTFTSPNYPDEYNDNQNCNWHITTLDTDDIVHLYIAHLSMEYSPNCSYDSVAIYDSDRYLLTKVCGTGLDSRHFYSSGQDMYVDFKSDKSFTWNGFEMIYSACKHWKVRPPIKETTPSWDDSDGIRYEHAEPDRTMYLESPHYPHSYHRFVKIFWEISCDYGYVVQIYVHDMDLQSSDDCMYGTVTILDSDGYRQLAKMCNDYTDRQFISTGHLLHVRLTSSVNFGRGFLMSYKAVRSSLVPTTPSPDGDKKYNYAVIFIGLIGGAMLFVCLCIAGSVYARRKKINLRTMFTRRSRTATANDQRLRVVPSSQPRSADNGQTNMAFSAHTEGPPSYSSLQHSQPAPATAAPSRGPNRPEAAPPLYTESMIITHPPSNKVEDDDTSIQSVTTETPAPISDVTAANPSSSVQQDAAVMTPNNATTGQPADDESSAV